MFLNKRIILLKQNNLHFSCLNRINFQSFVFSRFSHHFSNLNFKNSNHSNFKHYNRNSIRKFSSSFIHFQQNQNEKIEKQISLSTAL